jgi:hypothetical protein
MPIRFLDEEEEDVTPIPSRQFQQSAAPVGGIGTPATKRKIRFLDEEPPQQVGALPSFEEMFKPKPPKEGFFRQAADVPVGLAKGAAQGVRMFTDILGADNPVSQGIRGVEDYLGNLMSAQAKEDQQEIERIMKDAEDKGVLDQVMAGIKAFSVAPVDLTVQALGTMAPVVVGGLAANTAKLVATGIRGGAAAARGLTTGQAVATQAGVGLGTGAGVVKGTIYDEVKNELISQGLSEEAAHQQAVKAQEYGGKNLDQILLSAGLSAVASTTGAERIVRGILTKTGVDASKSRVLNALQTGITEAIPESAQGAQEQLAANLALQREGMEVPTTRGVFSSGALEGIAGFGVGAPLGAIQKASVAEDAARKAEEADAPQTANAIRKEVQQTVAAEKAVVQEEQDIEDTEKEMVPIQEEYKVPAKEEFKTTFAKMSPESIAQTEQGFREELQSEDADTRAFAQAGLDALAEFRAETTPPVEKKLPTDVLPTETPGATYGRESELYDVFAGVRRRPLEVTQPTAPTPITVPPVEEVAPAVAAVTQPAAPAAPVTPAAPEEPVAPTATAEPITSADAQVINNLRSVAENTANREQISALSAAGLVDIIKGQPVINEDGEALLAQAQAPLPRLTPEERVAEIQAAPAPAAEAPAIVEQEPTIGEKPPTSPMIGAEPTQPAPAEGVEPAPNWDLYSEELRDNLESFSPARDTGKTNYDLMDAADRFVEFAKKDTSGKPLLKLVSDFEKADYDVTTSQVKKIRTSIKALEESGISPIVTPAPAPAATAVTTPPAPEAVTPAPEGIAVGNRVKLGRSPQTYEVVEILPQSEAEMANDEQSYRIRNENTGEVITSERKGMSLVGGKAKADKRYNPLGYDIAEVVEDIKAGKTDTPFRAVNQVIKEAQELRGRIMLEAMRRKQPRKVGKAAILERIARERSAGTISEATARALTDFVNSVREDAIGDTSISIRQKGVSNFDFADNLVTFFLNQDKGDFGAAVGIHEFWHGLSRFLPESEVQKINKEYVKELEAYLKKNPWFLAFVGRYSLSVEQFNEYKKFNPVEAETKLEPVRDAQGNIIKYKIKFDKSNYRYIMLDEFIAEKMTDLVIGKQTVPNTFFGKLAKVFREFLALIKARLGLEPYEKFYQLVTSTSDKLILQRTSGVAAPIQIYDPVEYDYSTRRMMADRTQDARYAELEARAKAGDKEAEAEAQRMVDEAAKAAGRRNESGAIIDYETGKVLSESHIGVPVESQWQDNVDFGTSPFTISKDIAIAHTHPDESGLSDGDLMHLGWGHIKKIQAVTPYGKTFTIEKPTDTRTTPKQIQDAWNQIENEIFDSGRSLNMSVPQIVDEINQRISDQFGFIYTKDSAPIHPLKLPAFTYDDAGALIPLSQRFQPTTPDIRRMAVEAEPTVEAAEAPQRKPRPTTIQRLIEATTGVKRKRDLLTINEKTALKDQLKLGAKKRRLDAAQQKEFVKDLTAQLREEAIRGRVKAPQLRAIVNKAMQVRFDNDASILSFLNYANKVIDNANYDRDVSDARKAVSRAKQLSKQKGVPADAQKILERFSGIDPRQVDDPAEFAAVLNEFMAGYGDVLARDYIVIPNAEMDEYFKIVDEQAKEAQIDKEFQAMSNALNSELGKEGITDEEVAAILAMPEEDFVSMIEREKQEARTEKQKERAEAKEKAINTLSGNVQSALREYTNPNLTTDTKAILKDMQDIDLSQLNIGAKKEFVRAANGILVNNTFFGAEKFSARAKGQMGAARAAKDAKQKPRTKAMLDFLRIGQFRIVARATARKINLQLQSISDTFRNIAGKSGAAKLQEQMGMGDLLRGMAAADREKAEFSEALLKKLQEIEEKTGQKVSDPQGSKSMGVAATLIQTFPDETEAEGIARIRKMIEEQIIIMENSYDDKVVEDAKLVRRALEDVSADSVAGILENLKKAYPANYEMLMFVKDVALPSFKPLFKEHDELFNNQTDNYDNPNYIPLRFRQEGVTLEAKEQLQGYWNRGTINPKQAPNSIKRKKYTTLPKDRMFDFNMLKNVLGSVNDQLDATYTNAAWEQVKAFLDSPEGEIALGGKDNLDFVTERLNILASSRTRIYTQANLGNDIADSIANVGRATGYGYALGGIGQIPKQYFSQMITGFVNVKDKSLMMKSAKDVMQGNAKDIMSLFSIGMRGDIIGGTKWSNQAEGNYGKLEKFYEAGKFPQAKDALTKLNNLWLYPLKISDTHAAQTSWLAYYRQYLQDNNLEFKGWETEAQLVRDGDNSRNEAGNYAEMMTDLYQGSSDPTRMAAFAQRGKGGYENLVKSIFLPFLSFVLQERMRMFSDYRDAVYGAGKEKTEGAKALAGAVASQVVFHTVRRFMLPVMMGYGASLIYAMLGVDMDEPDEDKQKEEAERKWRQFKGEVLSNIFVGGFGAITEKSFLTAINGSFYFIEKQLGSENVLDDEGEVMDYKKYVEKRSPFWQYQGFGSEADYGMLSITPGQFGDVMDRLEKMSNEEFMDSLTEEERKLILVAGVSEILYTLRMNDADLNRMFRRMSKDVEEQAKEREKADKRLQQRYSSDR